MAREPSKPSEGDEDAPALRVSNPFQAERTGKCAGRPCLKDGFVIRKKDWLVVVSRGERRVTMHRDCAAADKRIAPAMRDLSADDLFPKDEDE